MYIYSIKDVKSGFTTIFSRANDELARRDFYGAVNSSINQLNTFPEDFELWRVSEFDIQSGESKIDLKFITNAISEMDFQRGTKGDITE